MNGSGNRSGASPRPLLPRPHSETNVVRQARRCLHGAVVSLATMMLAPGQSPAPRLLGPCLGPGAEPPAQVLLLVAPSGWFVGRAEQSRGREGQEQNLGRSCVRGDGAISGAAAAAWGRVSARSAWWHPPRPPRRGP